MIRRTEGRDWLLIAQRDHAHLAANMAAAWGNNDIPELPAADLLVPAVRLHDDGWAEWDRHPRIDPDHGRPRSFTEMPLAVSTAIWERSIESCRANCPQPWTATWVSMHFCDLAGKARVNRSGEAEEVAAADAFLRGQAGLAQAVREDVSRDGIELPSGVETFEEFLQIGFRWMQFFDRASLRLCCDPGRQPFEIALPGGDSLRWTLHEAGIIVVEAYPFHVASLELEVTAHRIPARRYSDDAEFQAVFASAPSETLHWRIGPV